MTLQAEKYRKRTRHTYRVDGDELKGLLGIPDEEIVIEVYATGVRNADLVLTTELKEGS